MKRLLALSVSHIAVLVLGFALGVYYLPIKIAPPEPSGEAVSAVMENALFRAEFRRDLPGSDWLHWGEGTVAIGGNAVVFEGELAPGPDYMLYLAPGYVEAEEAFLAVKAQSANLGRVRTFENFMVEYSAEVDLTQYNTVVVWCETFGQFITAAKYR